MTKKVLIIGAGKIAGLNEEDEYRKKPCTHFGAFETHPAFKVEAICDININVAADFARKFGIPSFFSDINQAMIETKADVVSVAVPYEFNCEIVKLVANHPCRPQIIFCEKPISDSLLNAEIMVNVCKKNKVLFFINNRRLTYSYQKFIEIFKKELGSKAITVNAWCSSGLHAIGIHMIDLLIMMFGNVAWVNATPETEYVKHLPFSTNFVSEDPRMNVQIGFKNDVVGNFTNTALTSFTYFEIEVLCRDGKLRISDNGNLIEFTKPIAPTTSTLSYRLGKPQAFVVQDKETLFSKISKNLAFAKEDGLTHPLSALHGLEAYRVLDAMLQSSKSGVVKHI